MNEQLLNPKGKELMEKLNEFFSMNGFGDYDVFIGYEEIPQIEYKNDTFRLVLRIKPAEPECEEQLQIPTIIFDQGKRRQGLFHKMMMCMADFCKQYDNMPIVFYEVVSEYFANKLIEKYQGIILADDLYSGKYIAVLPDNIC